METSVAMIEAQKPGLLRPIVRPNELIEAQEELSQLIVKGLKDGTDYGLVPGTKSKKTLFKAGAERLQKAYGCHTLFEIVEKEIDHDREITWTKYNRTGTATGLYRFVVKALVIAPNGLCVGSGIGSCSTMENKYVDRPRDLENTVLKMAQKRAKVAATLDAFALSDRFTQDMEDVVVDTPPPAARQNKGGFDINNSDHVDSLEKKLTAQGVPKDVWETVANKMAGRSSDELAQVLKEVLQ